MQETEKLIEQMLLFLDSETDEDDTNNEENCDSTNQSKINSKTYANAEQNISNVQNVVIYDKSEQYQHAADIQSGGNKPEKVAENVAQITELMRPRVRICGFEFFLKPVASVPDPYKPNTNAKKAQVVHCYDNCIKDVGLENKQNENAIWSTNAKSTYAAENYALKLRAKCRMEADAFLNEVNRCIYGKSNGHPEQDTAEYFQAAQNYAIYGKAFLDLPSNQGATVIVDNVLHKLAKNIWNGVEAPVLSKLDQELFNSFNGSSSKIEDDSCFNNRNYADLLRNTEITDSLPFPSTIASTAAHNEHYSIYNQAPTTHPTASATRMAATTTFYAEQQNLPINYQSANYNCAQSATQPPAFCSVTQMLYPTTLIRDQSNFFNCQHTTRTSYFERTQTQTYHQPQNLYQNSFAASNCVTPFFPQQLQTIEAGSFLFYANSQVTALPFTQYAAMQQPPSACFGALMQQNSYQLTQQHSYLPSTACTRVSAGHLISRQPDRRMLRGNCLPANMESRFTDRGTQTTGVETTA